MKIILELDDSISEFEANEMVESFLTEAFIINAKIEHCGKCNRNCILNKDE